MAAVLLMGLALGVAPAQAARHGGKQAKENAMTPSELQSQVMSFADRFVARLTGATAEYLYLRGHKKNPLIRAAVNDRVLRASEAAYTIAAGPNPEVSLLDMVVMVSLLKRSARDVWIPRKLTPHGEIFVRVFDTLEKDIWAIARQVLTPAQRKELRDMIENWHARNKGTLVAVTSVRFADFARKRRQSTLVKNGKPGGFLKAVAETNRELERSRVLAERSIFLLEREPTLLRWQVEQIFYDLAIEPESRILVSAAAGVGDTAKRLSDAVRALPGIISAERKAAIEQAFRELTEERTATIKQAITEISRERQALIEETSDKIIEKAFYLGLALIIVLLVGAILARLIYRYLELRLFERAGRSASADFPSAGPTGH